MAEWTWPVPGYSKVTSGVGPRWGREHKGIDIAAPIGATVVSARSGKVVDVYSACTHNYGKEDAKDPAGCGGGFGNRIYIDHGDGYITRYAHLTKLSVSLGDTVDAGQWIGTVGTTGNSTGPHLHFEIRLNGEVKDPEMYVSPSGSITPPAYSSSSLSSKYVDDSNLTVVGERVSNISNQPLHAYVQIYIGDIPLSDKPQYLRDFEITRYTGAGDTANFTIFDDSWSNIERDFAANWNNIRLKYGYVGGVSSRLYNMQLTNYSLTFNSTGTFLTSKAISQGAIDNLKKISSLPIETKNPTEAIEVICEYMGWAVGDLVETRTIVDEDVNFSIVNDFPVAHILEEIVPLARTTDKEPETVEFHLDSSNVANLRSATFKSEVNPTNMRTYIFQKGYDSPIIDLTFDIGGVFGGTSVEGVASGTRTNVINSETKEEISYSEDIKSVVSTATGEAISMRSDQSIPSIDSAGYSPAIAKARLYYDVEKDMTEHYKATMTIVGDPTISLLDNVRIINVTDSGHLHHTSGIYMIKGIVDHVSDGSMTTTLTLVRNGTGSDGGIEIISPKILLK